MPMAHVVKHNIKTLQPHSGAIILVLYHYLKFPDKRHFIVRMQDPFSKVYNASMEQRTADEIVFRTGRDRPCYSRVYPISNYTESRVRHDHSSVQEEFKIEGQKLYGGMLITEAGRRVNFEAEFLHPKFMRLIENYQLPNGSPTYPSREYQIDLAW